ncbi:MAG: glycosyltransferase [Bacteroidetes bacterium]|nr:MAG: glycosyltransferase [Bacteroidota bacterium]
MRILFCGQSGIPGNRSATLNRYYAVANAMKDDNEIIFINRIPLNKIGSDENSDFHFKIVEATNQKYRPESFLTRNFIKTFSIFYEFRTLMRLNKEKKIDWVNVYTQFFGISMFYYIASKIFRFRTILHYVEKRSEFDDRGLIMKLNDFLLEKFALFLYDRIIPISHKLNDEIVAINPNKRAIIIPPICDFEYFNQVTNVRADKKQYFLYCGSTAYSDVINFILDSYRKLPTSDVKLYMVLNGNISEETKMIVQQSDGRIQLFSNLEYVDLITLYKNSLALLIPLRNTPQDIARFPQKICEYLASGKVIISTNFGEVKYFFHDELNALLADEYDVELYSSKLNWVLMNRDKISKIEDRAYQLGKEYFDIGAYKEPLKSFIK